LYEIGLSLHYPYGPAWLRSPCVSFASPIGIPEVPALSTTFISFSLFARIEQLIDSLPRSECCLPIGTSFFCYPSASMDTINVNEQHMREAGGEAIRKAKRITENAIN